MEQQHGNPEKKQPPLWDNCDNCSTDYELTPKNTAARLYPKQEECSYLFCVCPNCNFRTRIFCGPETLEQAATLGIEIHADEMYAEPDIYHSWLDLNGIELPKTYELTNRHEAIVRRFGEIILSAPNEHLYDLITDTGYNKPHPQKWID